MLLQQSQQWVLSYGGLAKVYRLYVALQRQFARWHYEFG